jgi:putative colanic acid biosynthesis acetyltransferase WcaF
MREDMISPWKKSGQQLHYVSRPSSFNKLARFAWQIGYLALFRFTPTPFHGWRRLVLRLFGAKIGYRAVIYPSVRIWAPWKLEIADDATIGWNCEIYNVAANRIGREAIISQRSYLCTATHDLRDQFQLMVAPIDVAVNAWVAADAYLGPGVTVGEGAVVGARSVVTRSVEAWSIVAGNPARPVGNRPTTARNALHAR